MERKYIDAPGKYYVKVSECYLPELQDGEEKYHIRIVFADEEGATITARQYLGSEKQIEFVEKIFREVFGFGDRDTIDTIVSNINSDKNRVVGQECRITVEENNYVDKQGNQKMGVRVKYINAPRSSQPAEDLAGFKARIRAVRSGAFAAKPASAQSAPKPAAPARPSNPAPASDGDFSSDAPW